ncbi:MAG: Protein translocase subunit SecA, preprotein translocase subunit SecA [Candidatus Paceibacter sp.]|jgi:preprotein translocase subunit SecA|nr:Protein translocase subunit SecA, preprotein translocase subunit SecA [Candidatus Paceibacter sp.]
MLGLQKIFGDENTRKAKALQPLVDTINSFESSISSLTDEQLKAKTTEFKERHQKGETLDDLLPEAFATVREAAKRTLGQRHFDVQLIGGIILHQGAIAEMKTGEGKTLVATLPAYLNALSGGGVHVVTVNDYLSRRDAVWNGQIYALLGLSVGVINHDVSFLYDPTHVEEDKERDEVASFKVMYDFLRPSTRHEAYMADITYGTNNEFGFDYLRDNIEYDINQLRQRAFNFAIVDEVDSILIDEARTPLIISAPTMDSENLYVTFADIAEKLHEGVDYEIDEKRKAISMTDDGISKAEKLLGVENIYTDKGIKYVHHLETAVRAKALFKKEKEYVVRNDEVIIVDEFTGRMQPGRRWSDGLHQAIEAKERVNIQKETRTYASITFQNYFRLYKKLAGMTGTALTSKEEFLKVYGLDVFAIPTNKPIARLDRNDLIYQTEIGKFKAVARKVKEVNAKGQPVLVGTVSIEKNELLSDFLQREGVKHEVLNAKNHEREGEIVAMAGKKAAVTIATNMAGRGVDIKLGGPEATDAEREEIKTLGGLFVLGTERHEARRIDNQLRGRSGRQGDPGETQFFVSLEDSLMRIFASDTIKNLMGRFGIPEDQAIENRIINRSLETAQTKIEGFNFDARKHTLEYDDVLNYQRKIIYEKRRKALVSTGEALKKILDEALNLENADDETRKAIIEKKDMVGEESFYQDLRRLFLQNIDMYWIDHLEAMEYLRSSVNLRAYGQRDPLVEYKREGLKIFKEMEAGITAQVYSMIPSIGVRINDEEERRLREVQRQAQLLGGSDTTGSANKTVVMHGNIEEKTGRNERVTVTKNGTDMEIKFKKLEQFLKDGWTLKK